MLKARGWRVGLWQDGTASSPIPSWLALLIAALNKMPTGVVAAIFGYALGSAVVVTAFVGWQGQR
jgi:hypothetical protein